MLDDQRKTFWFSTACCNWSAFAAASDAAAKAANLATPNRLHDLIMFIRLTLDSHEMSSFGATLASETI